MSATPDIGTLKQQWYELKTAQPRLRARDAAKKLNISEAQLVALSCGSDATRLRPEWAQIIERIPGLGRVMALTRNESAVHEKKGIYENISSTPAFGLVVGEDIDLRLFWTSWHSAFAVRSETARGPLDSIQFFDSYGTAIHKIYLTAESNREAYLQIIHDFIHDDQSPEEIVQQEPAYSEPSLPEGFDSEAFRAEWAALRDTHDFFPLLRKFKLERRQSFVEAGTKYAYQVATTSVRTILNGAAATGLEIMVFVGNRGALQIYTGRVKHLLPMEEWFNIMDPGFNLHLRETDIHEVWVVRKPTDDGIVTSLELLDNKGNLIAMLFGKRKPGIPELTQWREAIHLLRPLGEQQPASESV